MALLLDTTVLIDALRGREAAARVRRLHDAQTAPWTCAVNVDEVLRGIREHERNAAVRLLSGLRMAPLGRAEGTRAGDWRRGFARRGITLSQLDVEHWPVGA
jgi:predicted nucleic acid-binding protein